MVNGLIDWWKGRYSWAEVFGEWRNRRWPSGQAGDLSEEKIEIIKRHNRLDAKVAKEEVVLPLSKNSISFGSPSPMPRVDNRSPLGRLIGEMEVNSQRADQQNAKRFREGVTILQKIDLLNNLLIMREYYIGLGLHVSWSEPDENLFALEAHLGQCCCWTKTFFLKEASSPGFIKDIYTELDNCARLHAGGAS